MFFLLNFWENDVCGPFGPFQSKPIIYLVLRWLYFVLMTLVVCFFFQFTSSEPYKYPSQFHRKVVQFFCFVFSSIFHFFESNAIHNIIKRLFIDFVGCISSWLLSFQSPFHSWIETSRLEWQSIKMKLILLRAYDNW